MELLSLIDELNSFAQKLFILLLVIVIKLITSRFIRLDALTNFQGFCRLLANKVNKPGHSPKQLYLSGTLAWLMSLTPIVGFVWLFDVFIEVMWLWQALLLWLALGWFDTRHLCRNIAGALKKGHSQFAKEKLKLITLRQTDSLSPLGLSKASIEVNLLRFNGEFATVIFIFLLFNPLVALTYRLIYETHLSWNPNLHQFKYFGRSVNAVTKLMQWPTSRLLGLLSIMAYSRGQFILMLRLTSKEFWKLSSFYLLQCHAMSLGVTLGGPAFYQKEKVRRAIANSSGRQPAYEDVNHSVKMLNSIALFCLVLTIGIFTLFSFLNMPVN